MNRPPSADRRRADELGSVLVQVAVALLALLAICAYVFDYGVMWSSRRQAQNAADAGALSGALALAFDNPTDQAAARAKAIAVAQRNLVWGQAPDVTPADVTFPACPPGAPGPPDTCVKVDVFRNQRPGGSPLPVFFARLVGITEQGVRATATAQVLYGEEARCVKPWAVPDKWDDLRDTPQDNLWTPDDDFERYIQNGQNAGQVMTPTADVYIPPGQPGHTGFTVEDDYGTPLTLKHGNPQQAIRPGWFFPVVINPIEGPGGNNYRDNIATCDPTVIGPGTLLEVEPGNMVGPTSQGVNALIAQDPLATWSASANGGRGAPTGGCMAAGTCAISPRLVALAIFNVDVYDAARAGGRTEIEVVKVLGFWIQGMQANDVIGYLTHYPALATGGSPVDAESSFLRTVILVR
ncbi:MAG TPA: Tad domain-containing protein [Vicinamibacterales bacterium]|nr:Tad domain-containing protein [Vicinamibacterales bacterium]